MKKKWTVEARGTITLVTVVEASTPEEARRLALERDTSELTHGAEMSGDDEAWVTTGELDCEVQGEDITSIEEQL